MPAPVPQNLGFEVPGASPGSAAGWVVYETPKAREFARFAATSFTPPADPGVSSWTVLNGPPLALGAAPPYDPGTLGDPPVYLQDDAAYGPHGVTDPTSHALQPGETYTFGVYVRSGHPFLVGPYVQVTATGGVAAVLDCATGEVVFAGSLGAPAPDTSVVEVVSAEATRLPDAGDPWVRVTATFKVADDATEPFLATAGRGVFLFAAPDPLAEPEPPAVPYAGPSVGGVNLWGFFEYAGALSAAESFSAGWGGNEGYASGLAVPETATWAVFPAEDPAGEPWDGFDRWTVPYRLVLDGVAASVGFGGPDPTAETFEGAWANDTYLYALASPTAAEWGGLPEEGFEVAWLNDDWTSVGAPSADATFSADLADLAETFERVYADVDYTADPATDKLVATDHSLPLGLRVHVVNEGGAPGSEYPAPLVKQLFYFVVSPAANDLKLSLTLGGAALDITTAGTGTQYLRADGRRYWNGPSINPTM